MKCQICGTLPATTHITQKMNGNVKEWHICSVCAKSKGFLSPYNSSVNSLFGSFFSQPPLRDDESSEECPLCGMTYRELVQGGQIGCPTCYSAFFEYLQPSIQRIHGKTSHVGKMAATAGTAARRARLKSELDKALAEQNYERCAQLRDEIKGLEAEEK